MTRGRGHTFDDIAKVQEMLSLRAQRVSTVSLAARYSVDHSTIIYHCKKHGLVIPRKKSAQTGEISVNVTDMVGVKARVVMTNNGIDLRMDAIDGTPVNPGKTYAEYLEIALARKEGKMYRDIPRR